ncbi:hypothetical protein [Rhodanobacter sp. BL-MT-08]
MQTRILCALIAMTVAGTAMAQAVQPSPGTRTPPVGLAGGLPPLPPGCAGRGATPPPPPRPPASVNDDGLSKGLGISSAQAAKVQKVFERQLAQARQLEQQHHDLDAQTCKDLRGILGDQGMARWAAAAPPPPPGGPGQFGPGRGPGRGPGGMMPPPPPPPQGN